MITQIDIKNVATYDNQGVRFDDLKKSILFMVQMVVERQRFQTLFTTHQTQNSIAVL